MSETLELKDPQATVTFINAERTVETSGVVGFVVKNVIVEGRVAARYVFGIDEKGNVCLDAEQSNSSIIESERFEKFLGYAIDHFLDMSMAVAVAGDFDEWKRTSDGIYHIDYEVGKGKVKWNLVGRPQEIIEFQRRVSILGEVLLEEVGKQLSLQLER